MCCGRQEMPKLGGLFEGPHMWLRRLITLLLALVAVLLFWTSQAAWGRVEVGNVRYKFGLLGVARITVPDSGPERNEPCGWYDEAPVALHCRPAAGAGSAFLLLRLAPVATAIAVVAFVLATFAHLRRGSKGA